MTQTVAFKIIDAAEWERARAKEVYRGSEVDMADGFIHLSTAEQLPGTARKHYAGRTGLMLLSVDLTALGDTVIWEPSRGGALFPHIHGTLPTRAVTLARACALSPSGQFVFEDATT